MRDAEETETAATRRRAGKVTSESPRPRVGRVLVAEDEQDVAELIRYHLTKDGYEVVLAKTGAEALRRAREDKPDVILLDIMIPQMNGWEVCRCLKREPDTADIPVIMVSGRVEEGDKVLGFELGADDYVTKPFPPRERFEVTVGGRSVDLTPKEFELLATLVAAPGRVFRRDELLDLVWGHDGFVEPRTVDVHMARLRAKFLGAKVQLRGVETVRGVGCRFREPQDL